MHPLFSALLGGVFVGLSASLFLLTHGRVAGISGLYGGLLRRSPLDRAPRLAFVVGLLASGVALRVLHPTAFETAWSVPLPLALVAGLLVGFGTQLGNGCTSGHGVCGISRFSARSFVATSSFIFAGIGTVFIVRHLVGGLR